MHSDVTPTHRSRRHPLADGTPGPLLVAIVLGAMGISWSTPGLAQRVPVSQEELAHAAPQEEFAAEEEYEPAHTDTQRGELLLAPQLSAHIGLSKRYMTDGSVRGNTHLVIYGGMSANVVLNRHVLSFIGGGMESEHHELDDGRSLTYFMPMLQSGLSFTGCYDDIGLLAATIPCARIYGMAGYRPAPPSRSGSLRLGIGVSSLWLTGLAASAEFLLPSHYEFITELDGHGNSLFMFRLGIGL